MRHETDPAPPRRGPNRAQFEDPREVRARAASCGVSGDVISIVEAAYDLTGDTRAWFTQLLEQAGPKLDRGLGTAIALFDSQSGLVEPASLVTRGLDPTLLAQFLSLERTESAALQTLSGRPMHLVTVTQAFGFTAAEARSLDALAGLRAAGVYDTLGAFAMNPARWWVQLVAPMPDTTRPSRGECARWGRLLAHVAAGARLRDAVAVASGAVDVGAEAVLSPSGAVEHAEPVAQGTEARESLRQAARAIDRARSKERANDEEALDLWQGLIAGRWSLVDRFDTDGRRFLIARKNDPDVADPRALTLRERQVLAYAAMGQPLKLIAYSLGLSTSLVSSCRKTAMRKLGMRTQADILRIFAPPLPPAGPHDG
jgi:DNA-binding CsgD family transcriptional regulator